MDYSAVAVLRSINPIEICPNVDKRTYEYLAKLRENKQFYNLLNSQRKMAPLLPININQFLGQNFDDLEIVKNDFTKLSMDIVVSRLLEEIGIDKSFHVQIFLLVFFNAVIDLKYFEGFIPKDIEFVTGKRDIINKTLDYKFEMCSLLIPYTATQRGLINYIKKEWKVIEKQMDDNLSKNPYIKKLHQNTQVAMEISELHEVKGQSFNEIADSEEFIKKYLQDFPNATDTNWVKKIYYDYKRLFTPLNQ